MSPAGGAYTFLAQIDCSRLPALPEMWPDPHPWEHHNALLRLFADLLGSPGEPCAAAALSAPGDRSFARAARPTSSYDDPERGSQDERLPECVVVARPFRSMTEVLPGLRAAVWDVSDLAQRYADFGERLRRTFIREQDYPFPEAQPHHLLGEALSIQDNVRMTPTLASEDEQYARQWRLMPDPALADREAWRTLLGLHSDDRIDLQIGDGGAFHVLVPVRDLAAGRLDRLVCDVSSL